MSRYSSELAVDLPVIKAHYADILCQLLEERGVRRQPLLKAAAIRSSALEHPDNLITIKQFVALNRAALEHSGDPALGLAFGRRLKFTTHGALSQAAISSDTIEEALKVLIKYFRIRFPYMGLDFYTDGDDAVIELKVEHDLQDLYVFNVEVVLASIMEVNLLLFGTRLLEGGSCRLTYPRPAHWQAYQGLFADQVRFDACANQLRFRRQFLDLPIALSNPVARRVAEQQCEEEQRQLESQTASAAGRVRRLLESVRTGRLPALEQVADSLGVSSRTLRRQLSAEGVRFQAILDRVRHARALELLTASAATIDDIADRLGYSDPSNFGRAFRKWEGVSPSAYRAAQSSR
ncbi:AraC family transcriptional regulator [Marinobacter xestospongiae]|uniref:AraC family transcriptional regulator n=1 Tax=Marinobacter xestospongiae TaxID=994319 RepID=A0ABU3VWY6_9GAMM|nr:AraC family transcriptional regulator [Marinobacter xestospongiae]MDV2078783.1 AraC family transcriptional regulator [Marinobacter xestospongiae]